MAGSKAEWMRCQLKTCEMWSWLRASFCQRGQIAPLPPLPPAWKGGKSQHLGTVTLMEPPSWFIHRWSHTCGSVCAPRSTGSDPVLRPFVQLSLQLRWQTIIRFSHQDTSAGESGGGAEDGMRGVSGCDTLREKMALGDNVWAVYGALR